MDIKLMILGIVAVVIICVGIIGYTITTARIIHDKDEEISKLKEDNSRLMTELNKRVRVSPLQSVKDKYPQFGDF